MMYTDRGSLVFVPLRSVFAPFYYVSVLNQHQPSHLFVLALYYCIIGQIHTLFVHSFIRLGLQISCEMLLIEARERRGRERGKGKEKGKGKERKVI